MTDRFNSFYESILREYLTAKSKRSESRYWGADIYPGMAVRKVRSSNSNVSDSQKTKILNQQQYVGDFYSQDGIRGKNKSEKDINSAAIARGIGGSLETNLNPGSQVNSKQDRMVVKYIRPNGIRKIGRDRTKYGDINPSSL
jgi:hypothetical protein